MPIYEAGKVGFNIIRTSHVELTVSDLERSRAFYVDALGLIETERDGDTLYLRALEERNHHSFVLRQAAEPTAQCLGFKVASDADLDALEQHFSKRGLETQWVERHAQGRTLRAKDIYGVPLEFYAEMEQVERYLQKFDKYRGAHIMRIDHFNCFSPSVQDSYDFYVKELGFRTSEYTDTEASDPQLWAAWLHRKGNVHDLALMNGKGPRLHHVGVWTETAMDILRACDILAALGKAGSIERGPGRHGLSNAMFLYLRDPDGHRIELYTGDYLTVDPDFKPVRWSIKDTQRQTFWGHAAPASWFEEGTLFADGSDTLKPQEAKLTDRPLVAS